MRVTIVGGGIVGLATAREVLRDDLGAEVVVLEREHQVGLGQTGHNSGVVHTGLYYQPGSLKARLCRRGMGLLREFCAEYGIAYEECGKLVVATEPEERERLEALAERANANGVEGLTWLDGEEMRRIEPHVHGLWALHSRATAIVDFTAVARAMADAIVAAGGEIRTAAAVRRIGTRPGSAVVELTAGAKISADHVIVCAGIEADRVARASGEPAEPRIVPFRGQYWKLRPDRAELVRGLIYPVPDPALPFLGVHLTKRIDGEVWLGPNAVLALARDGYRWWSVNPRDVAETFAWPGTWRMMARHWSAGCSEIASAFKPRFARAARQFVPELSAGDLVRAPAGVRAQAIDRDGSLVDDFRIGASGRVLWVRNAPSPAATSSLAIAEELVGRMKKG